MKLKIFKIGLRIRAVTLRCCHLEGARQLHDTSKARLRAMSSGGAAAKVLIEKIRVLREMVASEQAGRRGDAEASAGQLSALRSKVASLEAEIEKHRVAECSLAEQYYDVQLKCHDLEQKLGDARQRGASATPSRGRGDGLMRTPSNGRTAPYSFSRTTPGHSDDSFSMPSAPPNSGIRSPPPSDGRASAQREAEWAAQREASAAAVAEMQGRVAQLEAQIERLRAECADLLDAKSTSMNLVALLQKDKETFRTQAANERREHDAAREALEVLRAETASTRQALRDNEARAMAVKDSNSALAAKLMEYRRKVEVLEFGRERCFTVRVHRGRLAPRAKGELRLFMDSRTERAMIDIFCDGSHARRDMRQIVDVHATPGSQTRFEICFSEGVDARLGEHGVPGGRRARSLSATWGRMSEEGLQRSERASSTSIRAVLPSTRKELLDSDERDIVLSTIRGFLRLVQQQQDGVASIDGDSTALRSTAARSSADAPPTGALDSRQSVAWELAAFLYGS